MLPGLLQLAKFRKICIFDERALGGWEKGATRVIRKCLISFSSLCQSWWLLRTAQLQGGVLAPRKQAEQQSWAVFSASGKYLFAAEGAICQCTHCASSCLPAEGAASGQYWQLENPSTSGWLSCWDHTWTQKMVNECWHGNALSLASMVPVPCGSPQVFYHALFLDRRAKLIAPLCTSLIVSNLEDAASKHLGDLPVLNLRQLSAQPPCTKWAQFVPPLCSGVTQPGAHTEGSREALSQSPVFQRNSSSCVYFWRKEGCALCLRYNPYLFIENIQSRCLEDLRWCRSPSVGMLDLQKRRIEARNPLLTDGSPLPPHLSFRVS